MSRLVIDVTGEQHQKIKALAALQGKSIKSYVLDQLLPECDEEAMEELNAFLANRILKAENNPPAQKSFEELTQEIIQAKTNQ